MSAASISDPLAPSAARSVALASGLVLLAALVGAAIRLLPWALDPHIAWPTLAPFAKSLLSVAVEAAVLTGWPVGWAFAAQRMVDRGEARVLALLGESPPRTVVRLGPQAAALAALLAFASVGLGRDAAAPGRVVNDLLAKGRNTCVGAGKPSTYSVPFVGATWLCDANQARLVGRAPIGNVVFTANGAHVSDDLRRIALDDARITLPGTTPVHLHVGTMTLKGLAPWARASALPPAFRAAVVTVSALAAACAVVLALLRLRERVSGTVAVALGAAGPLAALASIRGLELRLPDIPEGATLPLGWFFAFGIVPVAAVVAVVIGTSLVVALPMRRGAGST